MEAANQPLNGEFEPVNAETLTDGTKDLLQVADLEAGAYGELMRRANEQPLSFSFTWRGTHFVSTVENSGKSMRLSLSSDLAAIPYSVEDVISRCGLLAVGETFIGENEMTLKIVQGHTIMIEHEIALPDSESDTMAAMVTQLTMLVLNSAPYLDLIAQFAELPPET